MTYWSEAFDCPSHFIKEERWDILAEGLRRCLSSLHEEGVLTVPVEKVTIGIKHMTGTEKFEVLMEFDDGEN